MAPPAPFAAWPVPTEMDPLHPLDAVPELNTKAPLMPFVPAFTDVIVMAPLDVAVPLPVLKVTAPPVPVAAWVLAPAATVTAPPTL